MILLSLAMGIKDESAVMPCFVGVLRRVIPSWVFPFRDCCTSSSSVGERILFSLARIELLNPTSAKIVAWGSKIVT